MSPSLLALITLMVMRTTFLFFSVDILRSAMWTILCSHSIIYKYNNICPHCQGVWWSYGVTIPTCLGASQASVPYSSPEICAILRFTSSTAPRWDFTSPEGERPIGLSKLVHQVGFEPTYDRAYKTPALTNRATGA